MNFDLIHIGMMKTATTYMQKIWLRDPNYCLSNKGSNEYLHHLRREVRKGKMNSLIKTDISTDRPKQDNQIMILSNEGFSTAFLNEIRRQQRVWKFIDYTSSQLRYKTRTNQLLITVREPISWIRSIYIQSIKQGWSGSAQDFVEEQGLFLFYSLQLKMILRYYKRYFEKILVLPFELLKENEDKFWHTITDTFQFPAIETRIENKLNQSLDLEKAFLLSYLNQMPPDENEKLLNFVPYDNVMEKYESLKIHSLYRKLVERATNSDIAKLYNLLELETPKANFFEFRLQDNFIKSIQKNYLNCLKRYIDPAFVLQYQQSFDQYIKQNPSS
ncbi:hypothetical protein [Gracilibacillus dipsosauri]|uniref:Sulfotransferase domain-containing protein n=1 Tax=Gracilibacillus dipsosauri TaxID=178340 RepID=A0A317L1E3_9BACI|nr:hypothetical protein [Gracilibacillus dipsosauri]PWU69296.1 hypothetical protein DLJ74_04735 [Gracilibacillus dipsosauri]